MKKHSRIFIVGHSSLVGSALLKRLARSAFNNIITIPSGFNLTDQKAVFSFFKTRKPEYLFIIDVISGGILANSARPAEFIYNNLQVQNNVIHYAWKTGTKKLIFIGSSCVYPKSCSQPMKEECLLTGALEPTSEAFAIAKIAGIKMCQYYNRQYGTNFISAIPATVYGQKDNFDIESSHVLPALMRRFHEAKIKRKREVVIWGTGKPRREFLYVDDMVDACIFLMVNFKTPEIINVGTGSDISIRDLAELLKEIVDFKGKLKFDTNKPDGVARKLLDIGRLKSLGWEAKVGLRDGLEEVYNWYKKRGVI